MDLDMTSARLRERRDGIPCVTIAEPEPSKVVHLFTPRHRDYDAARAIYETRLEEFGRRQEALS